MAQALRAQGKHNEAEVLLKNTLRRAEESAGQQSPLAGIVLLDLHDLYEDQSKDTEANATFERIREIMISAASQNRRES